MEEARFVEPGFREFLVRGALEVKYLHVGLERYWNPGFVEHCCQNARNTKGRGSIVGVVLVLRGG